MAIILFPFSKWKNDVNEEIDNEFRIDFDNNIN